MGASVLLNALLTIGIVALVAGGPKAGGPVGPAAGGDAIPGPGRTGRKLQQVMVEVDPFFQPWKAGTFDTTFLGANTPGSPITITRKVIFMGGFDVVSSTAEFKAGCNVKVSTGSSLSTDSSSNLKVDSPKLGLDTKAGTVTADSLSVAGNTQLGTTTKDRPQQTVVKVYGNIQLGKDSTSTIVDRTVIYPGKVSTSWNSGSSTPAKAWLGKALDDPPTKDVLSVWGTSSLGVVNKDLPLTTVAKVFGNIQLGKDGNVQPGTPFNDRTVIYPGKASMSWNFKKPTSENVLAKAWVGKAFDDAATKDQLSVYGSASLVTSRAKPYTFNSTSASLT